jgi:ADP-ribose pyrophosphatase
MKSLRVLLEDKRFQVVEKDLVTPDGQHRVRRVIRHPGAVVILPLLDDGRICLIHNYRITAEAQLVELPAGTLEPPEEPQAAAHRELAEETGYRAGQMELLTTFYSSPGIMDEKMYLFLAKELRPGPTALDGGEEISPLVSTWEEALAMARDGRIQDAKTLAGLLYYDAFRRR